MFSIALMASCSSDEGDNGGSGATGATGGTGGSTAGVSGAGTGGSAGTTTTGGSAGTTTTGGTGGSSGAGAGTAGTGAGTAGTAGTAGSAGSGGTTVVADPTAVPPTRPQITDFTDVDSTGAEPKWGGDPMTTTLTGGFYYYPMGAITGAHDTAAGTWTITGNAADYAGFGMWFDVREASGEHCPTCAIDATGCTGISFKISGTGPTADVAFRLQAWDNYPHNATEMKGSCVPVDPAEPWVDCVDMESKFALPATEMEVQIPFAMLAGGKPLMTGGESQMVGLQFALPWDATATAYDINIVVKDLKFYGGATCAGGGDGTGGMGGSAGAAGSAGSAGTAGMAGTAGGGAGGQNGGQGGVAGTAGTAGTANGGTAGNE